MSSIRHEILRLLNDKGILLLDDIQTATGEKNRKRLVDNVNGCITDGLVKRIRDDVTGQPAYDITAKGRERLEEGVRSKGGENRMALAAGIGVDSVVADAMSMSPCGLVPIDAPHGYVDPRDELIAALRAQVASTQDEPPPRGNRVAMAYAHVRLSKGGIVMKITEHPTEDDARREIEELFHLTSPDGESMLVALIARVRKEVVWEEAQS